LATVHDGCNVQLGGGGAHAESMDFAWMEGFASYYAAAVGRAFNTSTTTRISGPSSGTFAAPTLESPACPNGPFLPRAFLGRFVGGALWELADDSGPSEPFDRLCNKDDVVFSIFDRELQRRPANIQTFTDAWIARGLDFPPLRSAFAGQGVTVTGP